MAAQSKPVFGPDPTPAIFACHWRDKFDSLQCDMTIKDTKIWIRHLQHMFLHLQAFKKEAERLGFTVTTFPRDKLDTGHRNSAIITCSELSYANPFMLATNLDKIIDAQVDLLEAAMDGKSTFIYSQAAVQEEEWRACAKEFLDMVEVAAEEELED